jgi:hypothetical protein
MQQQIEFEAMPFQHTVRIPDDNSRSDFGAGDFVF